MAIGSAGVGNDLGSLAIGLDVDPIPVSTSLIKLPIVSLSPSLCVYERIAVRNRMIRLRSSTLRRCVVISLINSFLPWIAKKSAQGSLSASVPATSITILRLELAVRVIRIVAFRKSFHWSSLKGI